MEFLALSRRRSSARNVLSCKEWGETDVFAVYIKVSFTFLINFIFFFNWRNRHCIPNWSIHSLPKKVTLRISKSTKTKIITLLFMKAFKHFTHSCCILFSTFPSLSQASLKCLSKIFIPSSPNCWIQLWNNQKIVSLQMSHNYGYKEALPG